MDLDLETKEREREKREEEKTNHFLKKKIKIWILSLTHT
jgi:hypothetical protein